MEVYWIWKLQEIVYGPGCEDGTRQFPEDDGAHGDFWGRNRICACGNGFTDKKASAVIPYGVLFSGSDFCSGDWSVVQIILQL